MGRARWCCRPCHTSASEGRRDDGAAWGPRGSRRGAWCHSGGTRSLRVVVHAGCPAGDHRALASDGVHQLVYVGIARSAPPSRATLRSRVVGNHIRGTTGQSTLRRSLASLLYEQEGWRSRFTDRPLLVADAEGRLNDWMQKHLAVSWAVIAEPWTVEDHVISELTPPLNQSANSAHPLYRHVREARARWRTAARAAVGTTDE